MIYNDTGKISEQEGIKDTDGLKGFHWMIISHKSHSTWFVFLIQLQLNIDHISSNSEQFWNLLCGHLVIKLLGNNKSK